jgi:molecular chaperone Hsp33
MSQGSARTTDALHRFVFEHHPVRGEIVRLDASWRTVLERRRYPPAVRQVLGQALAATALLFATIKFRGRLTLQLQGPGPLHLLVVQCSDSGEMRALARWHDPIAPAPLAELCGHGTLAVTIEPDGGRDRYQGVVQVDGPDVGSALETYFVHSEQLPTRLWLCSDRHTAAGLLLQRLPGEDPDADAWDRLQQLGASLTTPELLTLDAERILRRLFHQDTLRLFDAQPLGFHCNCSRERTTAMLRALGADELHDILAERGHISVACEFCGMDYRFDAVDVAGLLNPVQLTGMSDTLH